MALLQVSRGPDPGRQYPLENDRTVVGRHPDCGVVLDVAAVSRQHAQVIHDGRRFFVEDLGSRNGTLVNEQQIHGRQLLNENDRINICDVELVFFVHPPSSMLAGPLPGGLDGGLDGSRPLLLDDDALESKSLIMSTLDVAATEGGACLAVRPEVKLAAVLEIARNLSRTLLLDEVLPKLLDSLFKIFGQADRGFIVLRATADGPLVPKAVKYRRPSDTEEVRISRTIIQQAMNSKEAILSADAATDERFDMAQSVADLRIRSLMCAPLTDSEGRALGVIQVDTLDRRQRFNSDDLEVLASVAAQAAVAIDNAQLHEQAIRQQAFERDLVLARRVQHGLMPAQPPVAPNYHFFNYYEAADQVGGDYYDYVPLAGGRIAVVLADVSGKGVSAALLMAKLAGDARFALATAADPAAGVGRLNAGFAQSGNDDRFVTFVAAVLDPATHELTIVNAGHMPPLLRRGDGKVEELGAAQAGLPLGVDESVRYEPYRRRLEPGECIVLFTDGISEAMNARNQLYGLRRLRRQVGAKAVSVADLGQHILDDVRKFVGGRPQSDDMCLACFGRAEE